MSRLNLLYTTSLFILTLLAVLNGAPFAAASVQVNATFDLENEITGTPGSSQAINSQINSPLVTISEGDEVEITYSFLNGQRLRMSQSSSSFFESLNEWLRVADGTSGFFSISDITVELLDFTGSPGLGGTLTNTFQTSGFVHLGPSFSNVLPTQGSFMEFSGLRATFTVDDLPAPSVNYTPWLLITADTLEAVDAAAVPEAYSIAIWSLLAIAGLAAKARVNSTFA